MKTLFCLAVLIVGVARVHAQTNAVPSRTLKVQSTRAKVNRAFAETPITQAAGRMGRKNPRYAGFLVEFARAPHPLQWVDPFRPATSSAATENVLRDPRTGQAQGVALLSLRF